MGIINLTPDSFYGESRIASDLELLQKVEMMLLDGADIIDIGAVSTRPDSKSISDEEELFRLIGKVNIISQRFPEAVISVDTYRSNVAREAVSAGAHIINDISGGTMDIEMFQAISKLRVPYILMHIVGTPETMQINPIENNVTSKVKSFFINQIEKLNELGHNQIILDPGFGFGKTLKSNYQLLSGLEQIRIDICPILVGLSRKSMINKVLNTIPEKALTGTIGLNMIALMKGANILRVHDVKEAQETIEIFNYYIQ